MAQSRAELVKSLTDSAERVARIREAAKRASEIAGEDLSTLPPTTPDSGIQQRSVGR